MQLKNKRHVYMLLVLLAMALLTACSGWQRQDVEAALQLPVHSESSVVSPLRQQHHEATLTDTTHLYRVCSSRPQRILPSQGAKVQRTLTPSCSSARQRFVKPLRSYFDSRCRLESAPFCLSASCDYYVIALRHIIR